MAAASLACCGLPLAAVGLGLGAGGAAVFLERYQWDFIGTAAVLLSAGSYLNYRRAERCAPDGSCPPERPIFRTVNRAALWISAVMVVGFGLFPELIAAALRGT